MNTQACLCPAPEWGTGNGTRRVRQPSEVAEGWGGPFFHIDKSGAWMPSRCFRGRTTNVRTAVPLEFLSTHRLKA